PARRRNARGGVLQRALRRRRARLPFLHAQPRRTHSGVVSPARQAPARAREGGMNPREAFLAQARERILVFDGAFGTQIQARRLREPDYAGDLGLGRDQGGNNDILALTRPDVIADITRAYFEAGSDMVST